MKKLTKDMEHRLWDELMQLNKKKMVPFSDFLSLKTEADFVYLSDLDTHELLYINALNPEAIMPELKDFAGKKCYKILQNLDEPCPFCTNHLLREDQYYLWKIFNKNTKKHYVLKDKLVEWQGRKVRLEVVMDVSEKERSVKALLEILESQSLQMSCNQILSEDYSLRFSLEKVLASVGEFFQASSCYGILYDKFNTRVAWSSDVKVSYKHFSERSQIRLFQALTPFLKETSQVLVNDVMEEDLSPELREYLKDVKIHSYSIKPIFCDNKLVGIISVHNYKKNESQLAVLDMIATEIGRKIKQAALQEENSWLQYHDPLTGYSNFTAYHGKVEKYLRDYPDRKYSVWYCDIKRFKYVNNVYGYEAGDRLLKYWAELLNREIRPGETFCRISGDNMSFFFYYEEVGDLEKRFQHISKKLYDYMETMGIQYKAELITGIYLLEYSDVRPTLNTMLDWANIAHRSAKGASGDRLAFFTEELRNKHFREMLITQNLHKALENGEIFVKFQPQYNFSTNELVGAEALVRWSHNILGDVSPGEFIPILERNGNIYELDRYVWEQSCKYLRRWLDAYPHLSENFALSVNVSRIDIYSQTLFDTLMDMLERYRLSMTSLRLEITESAYMENPHQLIDTVKQLRARGFIVKMDDFGSGFSSLNMLKDVPVDMLKLDMQFLAGEMNSARGGNILHSIVRMARWLSLPVMAEGVETLEQANYLNSIGCQYMQGYYFSKPLTADELEEILPLATMGELREARRYEKILDACEFLDPNGNTSYLFNNCIGGAGIFEYSDGILEALILNDQFFAELGGERSDFIHWKMEDGLTSVYEEDRALLSIAMEQAIAKGKSSCDLRATTRSQGPATRDNCHWIRVLIHHLSSNGDNHIFFGLVHNVDAYKEDG